MNNIKINNQDLSIKEFNGQRVITLKEVDMVHNRPDGTARKRFNDNKERFIEGEDYFNLTQPSEIRTLGFERPQGGIPDKVILLAESGYLMLVKSFTDDLAWRVQRELVNTYFKAKIADYPVKSTSLGEVTNFLKHMDKIMVAQGSSAYKRANAFEIISQQFGVELPRGFIEPVYEQAVLTITTNQLRLI